MPLQRYTDLLTPKELIQSVEKEKQYACLESREKERQYVRLESREQETSMLTPTELIQNKEKENARLECREESYKITPSVDSE